MAHTTNYFDTVILPAEDCTAIAKVPTNPDSVAALQYGMLADHPYAYTSDDVLSGIAARRKGVTEVDRDAFREAFFSKGQPCFRASPLTRTHGWAIHADGQGRIALLHPDDVSLGVLMEDGRVKVVTAMRSNRA